MALTGKTVLITGGARRVGRMLTLAAAGAGANVIIHHSQSAAEAEETAAEARKLGVQAWVIQADFEDPQAAVGLVERAWDCSPVFGLVNNAAIFKALTWADTDLDTWNQHLAINLTAPFLLDQAFARRIPTGQKGRIVHILDWRALRPGADHFPYTVSKAALAAMTKSLAVALSPNISVNGIAFGAVLPPSDGAAGDAAIRLSPLKRWAEPDEVARTLLFLLDGPEYVQGEILHLDGGRHLI